MRKFRMPTETLQVTRRYFDLIGWGEQTPSQAFPWAFWPSAALNKNLISSDRTGDRGITTSAAGLGHTFHRFVECWHHTHHSLGSGPGQHTGHNARCRPEQYACEIPAVRPPQPVVLLGETSARPGHCDRPGGHRVCRAWVMPGHGWGCLVTFAFHAQQILHQ